MRGAGLIILVIGAVFIAAGVGELGERHYCGISEVSRQEAIAVALRYSSGSFSFVGEEDPVELIYDFSTKSEISGFEYTIDNGNAYLFIGMGVPLVLLGLLVVLGGFGWRWGSKSEIEKSES